MRSIPKGMLAGLAATIVLSAMMVAKSMMGLMPKLDVIQMLSNMLGAPNDPPVGWIAHFVIGVVVYGIAIALIDTKPGANQIARGVMLGVVGWLIMMVVLMPMAGAGLFGMSLGPMAAVATLVLHLIFGFVLGWVYGRSTADASSEPVRARA